MYPTLDLPDYAALPLLRLVAARLSTAPCRKETGSSTSVRERPDIPAADEQNCFAHIGEDVNMSVPEEVLLFLLDELPADADG
ncbi:hypothetical protein EYF80_042961 [Liparis tanakae]|uniref:Uncharacterized protein n=1 Tax=Liparis tanakae TaxID=230148 RepID=A0A4Z2G0M4_9TELE|nr:hypothetical protein EYF80_042961 [Liparis tanakae]